MKLRNKKGFTIIELVIVIAVIGILTAVLVPTFINLTNRANESADESNLRNMNTLAIGSKNLDEAKQKLTEGNMNPEITPAIKDRFYAWDDNKKEFLIAGEKSEMKDGKFAVVRSNTPDSDGVYTVGQDKWQRLVAKEIKLENSSDLDLTVFHPVYKPVSAIANITINQSADIDFGRETFNAPSTTFTIEAGLDKASININGSGVKLDDFIVSAPNADVTHTSSLTITTNTVDLNVAPHSYNLLGALLIETKLEMKGNSNLMKAASGVLNIKDTATVTAAAESKVTIQDETGKEEVIPAAQVEEKVKEESDGIFVSNETELRAAIEAKEKKVFITDDITDTQNKPFRFLAGMTIYGSGHTISSNDATSVFLISGHNKANGQPYDGSETNNATNKAAYLALQGTPYIWDENDDLVFSFHGLQIYNVNNKRGISTFDVEGATLNLDGCTVSASSYALNLHRGTNKLTCTIDNCVVNGWSAINSRLQNSSLHAKNSVFTGINKHTGASNSFSTICIDGDTYWYQSEAGVNGSNSTYVFENTEIQAKETTETRQDGVYIQLGASKNTVTLNNCSFNTIPANKRYTIDPADAGTGNKITVDGTVVASN